MRAALAPLAGLALLSACATITVARVPNEEACLEACRGDTARAACERDCRVEGSAEAPRKKQVDVAVGKAPPVAARRPAEAPIAEPNPPNGGGMLGVFW